MRGSRGIRALVALGAAAALTGCGSQAPRALGHRFVPATPVAAIVVQPKPLITTHVYTGTVVPYLTTVVAPAIGGILRSVDVEVGQPVRRGQVLAVLDTTSLRSQLGQDLAQVAAAQAQAEAQAVSTENALEEAGAAVATAESQLANAEAQAKSQLTQQEATLVSAKVNAEAAKTNLTNGILTAEKSVATAEAQFQAAQTSQSSSVAQAQAAVNQAQAALEQAQNNLAAAETTYEAQRAAQQAAVAADRQTLQAAEAQVQADQAQLQQAEELAHSPDSPSLVQAENALSQAQEQLAAAQAKLAADENNPAVAQAEGQVATAKAQVASATAALKAAQTNLQAAETGVSVRVAQAELQQAQANLQAAEKSPSVAQAEAALNEAEAALQATELQAQHAVQVAKAQLAQQQVAYQAARRAAGINALEAQVGVAKAQAAVVAQEIEEGVVRAPVDGVVTAISAQVGQGVGANQGFITIQSDHPTMATINVPEFAIGTISPGERLSVRIPSLGRTVTGVVDRIVPTLQPSTDAYAVNLILPNPGPSVLPGMTVEALQNVASGRVLSVPADAVVTLAGGAQAVFVVEHGRAVSQLVQVGQTSATTAVITSGLKPGDMVVVAGQNLLSSGEPVRVVPMRHGQASVGLPVVPSAAGAGGRFGNGSRTSGLGGFGGPYRQQHHAH